jgi:hypothetical protein
MAGWPASQSVVPACTLATYALLTIQALLAAQQLSVAVGLGILVWLVVFRYTQSDRWWLESHALAWVNLATGILCLLLLLPCCALYSWRALKARRQHRRW